MSEEKETKVAIPAVNQNTVFWDSVAKTDPRYTKEVSDGRHTFTTIEAYYQIKQATKVWGQYGSKWGLRNINYDYHEALAVLTAEFFWPDGSFEIGNAIKWQFNNGGVDGDFVKKIETDTITKAMSRLGFNADVFTGEFDDNRYVRALYEEMVYITKSQIAELNTLLTDHGADYGRFLKYMGVQHLGEIDREDFDRAVSKIKEKPLVKKAATAKEKKAAAETGGKDADNPE